MKPRIQSYSDSEIHNGMIWQAHPKSQRSISLCFVWLAWIALVCCIAPSVQSQPPPNDTCAGAVALSENVPYTMNTDQATTVGDTVANCEFNPGKGVWFTYTPSVGGVVIVRTCGSDYSTVLSIYTNSCGGPSITVCGYRDDAFCGDGYGRVAAFIGTTGVTYRILVQGYNWQSGNLRIEAGPPVLPNDTCAGAVALSENVPYTMNTDQATTVGDMVPNCEFNPGKGVWFTYTPCASGVVIVRTCGSGYSTVLSIYTNSCGALGGVVCGYRDDAFCGDGYGRVAAFIGTTGATYRILVQGYNWQSGNLRIVAGVRPTPRFTSQIVSGTNLVLSGTCGMAGSNYVVLASTNVAAPLSTWTRLLTNRFTASGNFSFTNGISPSNRQRFFVIQAP